MNERDRIELIMKSYNLTPSQFADRTGIQRASVSHIISGRNKASLEVMLKIFDAFPGLDMQWLMTGKGNAPTGDMERVQEALPSQSPAMPPVQNELFSSFATTVATAEPSAMQSQPKVDIRRNVAPERAPRRSTRTATPSTPATAATKRIKEIRIFYTDGTYETMIPEK